MTATQPFYNAFIGPLDDKMTYSYPVPVPTPSQTAVDVNDLEVSIASPAGATGTLAATVTGSSSPIVRLLYPQFDHVWDDVGIEGLAKLVGVPSGSATSAKYDFGRCIEGVGTCSGSSVAGRLLFYISTRDTPVAVNGKSFIVNLTIVLSNVKAGATIRGYVALRM
jgi:hypothetical protein